MKKSDKTDSNRSHKHDYPDEEIWNTANTLARLIAPRLLAFAAIDKHGFPVGFADMRQWNSAIQQMADAFELMSTVRSLAADEETAVKTGLDLFCKYYRNLWD